VDVSPPLVVHAIDTRRATPILMRVVDARTLVRLAWFYSGNRHTPGATTTAPAARLSNYLLAAPHNPCDLQKPPVRGSPAERFTPGERLAVNQGAHLPTRNPG
jgi:hypothetical protein